ncbi:MAG: cadherin domain-containing protein [Labrys sp. (in: a-proteobacteria)]
MNTFTDKSDTMLASQIDASIGDDPLADELRRRAMAAIDTRAPADAAQRQESFLSNVMLPAETDTPVGEAEGRAGTPPTADESVITVAEGAAIKRSTDTPVETVVRPVLAAPEPEPRPATADGTPSAPVTPTVGSTSSVMVDTVAVTVPTVEHVEAERIAIATPDAPTADAIDPLDEAANNAPDRIELSHLSIDEDAGPGAVVGLLSAFDPDPGDVLTLSLTGGRTDLFAIVDGQLVLKPGIVLDFETGQSHSITVTATDSSGLSTSRTFTISVVDGNETPQVAATLTGQSATEDAAFTAMLPAGAFTDVDVGDTLTLSATLADGSALPSWLSFDPATGTFSGTPANGDVGSLSIRVTATDTAGASATQTFGLTVANTNDAPVITSGATATFAENATGPAYAVTATDVDAGASLTYSLSGTDAALFTIDAATGAVTFKSAPDFEAPADSGTDNVYDVVVHASDGMVTTAQAVAITVTNANEGPVFTSATAVSVSENATGTVYTAAATDPEGTARTYSLSGTDAALFDIDATTGAVTFKSAPNFEAPADQGGNNVYDVVVNASDGVNVTSQAVAITVTNVNEGPVITSGTTASFAENATGTVYTATSTDPEGSARTYSLSGTDAALFNIDATTGAVTFKSAPNFEALADQGGNNVYDVVVNASDGVNTTSQAVAITVTNVNEGPVITSGTTASFAENATGTVYTATSTDPEGAARIYSLSGTDVALFNIDAATGAVTFKSAPNFEAPADQGGNNVYDVVVNASDGVNVTSQAVAIAVTNVNEGPVITSGTTASFAENGTGTVYTATATDPEGTARTYSLSGTDAALFNIDATTGAVTFKASPDFEAPADQGGNNVYDVVVNATDGVNTTSQAVAIAVRNVNEAPTGLIGSGVAVTTVVSTAEFETGAAATTWTAVAGPTFDGWSLVSNDTVFESVGSSFNGTNNAGHGTAVDLDGNRTNVAIQRSFTGLEPNETYVLTFRASSGGVDGAPNVDDNAIGVTINGVSTTIGAADLVTTYQTFTVAFTADVNGQATIRIAGVDPTPDRNGAYLDTVTVARIDASDLAAVAENASNGTVLGSVTGVDPDQNDHLTYSLTDTADGRFAIDGTTGVITVTDGSKLNFENATTHSVGIRVTDSGGLTVDRLVMITVGNVNETPVFTSGTTASFAENGTGTVYTATSTDPEGTALSYSLSGTDAALFNINATTGAVTFKSAPNFEAPADQGGNNVYDVVVNASDGVNTTSQAVAITVTNVNEGPVVTSDSTASFAENGTGTVYTVTTTDPEGTARSYTLSGTDAALFNIDATTGAVTFKSVPNFESPADQGGNNIYDVVVNASDGVNTTSQAVAITVTNVNEGPVITSGTTTSFAENATGTVYTATSTDPEGTARTYSLSGTDAALFNINATTGAVTFKASPNFEAPADQGGNNVYDVVVNASDGVNTTSQAVAITVTNVNEGPIFMSGPTASFAENGTGTVYTATTTDPEGSARTYSLSGTDAALFNIDATTGAVTFKASPDFEAPADQGGNNVYDVVVNASDGVNTTSQAVAITVTNVSGSAAGTTGSDAMSGTSEEDVMSGGDGNDTLLGSAGADTIDGGAGIDTISYAASGAAVSVNLSLSGAQVSTGDAAGDQLSNIENVIGSGFGDTLTGTTGANSLDGGAGDDTIAGGGGVDTLTGGLGNDRFTFAAGDVTSGESISGGDGTDTLAVSGSNNFSAATLSSLEALTFTASATATFAATQIGSGLASTAVVTGSSGTDALVVNLTSAGSVSLAGMTFQSWTAGTDTITVNGSSGHDTIEGSTQNDVLVGGSGVDMVSYASATSGVTVNLSVTGPQATGGAGVDTISGFEQINGSAFADTLTGDAGDNYLIGGLGNDTISGGDGTDILAGGLGADSLMGGAGDDAILVISDDVSAGDVIDGGAGSDVISGFGNINLAAATITSIEGLSNLGFGVSYTIASSQIGNGLSASLSVVGSTSSTDAIIVNVGTDGTANLSGWTFLSWTAGTDTITVNGSSGNDTILGSSQNDSLVGGAGNDTLSYGGAASGVTVSLAVATAQVTGGAGTDTVSGFENLTGSAFNDALTGDGAANILTGGAGNDTLTGGALGDTISGGDGVDTANYSTSGAAVTVNLTLSGAQTSTGDASGDVLSGIENVTGSALADTLTGDAGQNRLDGGAGDDTLQGGGGADTLVGGVSIDSASYAGSADAVQVDLTNTAAQVSTGDASGDILSGIEGLIGSAFNDALTGDNAANTIAGGQGADTLSGGGGNDTLDYRTSTGGVSINLTTNAASGGDAAGDVISGFENVYGSSTAGDTLVGDGAGSILRGYGGVDTINAGLGNDTIDGGTGADRLYGEDGNDTFVFVAQDAASGEIIDGGAGTDTLSVGGTNTFSSVTLSSIEAVAFTATSTATFAASQYGAGLASGMQVTGSIGTDTLAFTMTANSSVDLSGVQFTSWTAAVDTTWITGSTGAETIRGTSQTDSISGGAGNDEIDARDGDDTVEGGAGADKLVGGAGLDTLSYSGSTAAVSVNLATNTVSGGDADGDTISQFERVTGSAHGDTIIGDNVSNTFWGMGGNDTIEGGAGWDWLLGGAGADSLSGGADNDTFVVDNGEFAAGEFIDGGTGSDTLRASGVNDFSTGTIQSIEGLTFSAAGTATFAATQIGTGLAAALAVTGSAAADAIVVNLAAGGSVNLSGLTFTSWTAGTDTITVNGSTGDETIQGSSVNDVLSGGSGTDTLSYAGAGAGVTVNLAITTAQATGGAGTDTISGFENLTGSAFNDSLTGSSVANSLVGGTGNDTITGAGGNDTIDGGVGTDTAVFSGNWRDYTITQGSDANGSFFQLVDRRSGSPDGTDRVYGVENFQFADGTITVSTASDLLNDGPTGATWQSGGTVAENSAAGTVVGTILGTDPDSRDVLTYALTDNAGGRFQINASTGQVTVASGASLSFEAATTHSITAQVTDAAGSTVTQTLTIAVADAAEALTLTAGNDVFVDTGVKEVSINGGDGDDSITGTTGADSLLGGNGNDTLIGGDGVDTLIGGAGDDVLYDGNSDDVLDGGEGSDTYYLFDTVGTGSNTITDTGTGGTDRVILDNSGGTNSFELQSNFSAATSGIEAIEGSAGTGDYLTTNDASANFDFTGIALTGIEGITGTANADTITGSGSDDVIAGNDGNDRLFGGLGADNLSGGNGDDSLSGGAGNDTLAGGAGNDTLIGGAGNDSLFGDAGADLFVMQVGQGNDAVAGGMGGSWIDTIELTDASGASYSGAFPTDWTLVLTQGSVVSTGTETLDLSQDSAGYIQHSDGTTTTFSEIEQIRW